MLRKPIFLLDALGAIVSATMHAVILPLFLTWHGIPVDVLLPLGFVAAAFATYSLACFFLRPSEWRPWLRRIAVANILFCVVVLSLIALLWNELTGWGVAYLVGEIVVVGGLARYELEVASRPG